MSKKTKRPISRNSERVSRIETGAATGTLAGAAVGAVAGPAGIVAGAVIGGVAGAVAGLGIADEAEWRHRHAASLDLDIGVTGGDLGAASPDSPPTRIGAFSAGSAGASEASHGTPTEGPMQSLDD